MFDEILEVILRAFVVGAPKVDPETAGEPSRQCVIPVTFPKHRDELTVVSRHQFLGSHQILFVPDAPCPFVSSLFVVGRANQQHEVAQPNGLFHEIRETIAEFENLLIDYDVESVRLEPEGESRYPSFVGRAVPRIRNTNGSLWKFLESLGLLYPATSSRSGPGSPLSSHWRGALCSIELQTLCYVFDVLPMLPIRSFFFCLCS